MSLPDRKPIVAGQFYPADPASLAAEVNGYLALAENAPQDHALVAMAPHAGYVYSGQVAARTIAQAGLHPTVLLLGPNHTGLGQPFALWPEGRWAYPGGAIEVDTELAQALLGADSRIVPDVDAHLREHSLEVMLPFLAAAVPGVRIVPLAVAEPSAAVLVEVGRAVGEVLSSFPRPVSMLVSSDMSHYVSEKEAKAQDSLALDAAFSLDPMQLYSAVRINGISMCGVLPMTLALAAASVMGAQRAELVDYATSGEASGDYAQVVGYAGMIVC